MCKLHETFKHICVQDAISLFSFVDLSRESSFDPVLAGLMLPKRLLRLARCSNWRGLFYKM